MSTASQTQWFDFWQRLGAQGDPLPGWLQLHAAYSESWRAYHNLVHLGHCLAELESVRGRATNPVAIEAAIWFHDAVYDTRQANNEERSADLADRVLTESNLPAGFREVVRRLILATKHTAPPADNGAALLVDIDLAILGQNPARYADFEEQIRREYEWVAPADFAAGRSAVLRGFLNRESIYASEFFREKYERQARENLQWAIRRLAV